MMVRKLASNGQVSPQIKWMKIVMLQVTVF